MRSTARFAQLDNRALNHSDWDEEKHCPACLSIGQHPSQKSDNAAKDQRYLVVSHVSILRSPSMSATGSLAARPHLAHR